MAPASRPMKRTKANNITSLPGDLLKEVLARVAAGSVSDLLNLELSCKDLLELGCDDYVFEHASMEKFPEAPWPISHKASLFLKRCRESGNPEALYRQGMLEFFSLYKTGSGFQFLKKAAKKGHMESIYVFGIILLCSVDNHFKQDGVKLLSSLKSSEIRECRIKIKRVIWNMWIHNSMDIQQVDHSITRTCNCLNNWNTGWEEDTTSFMKRKRTKPTNHKAGSSIKFIPNDLLTDILSRVASDSIIDLFNMELCCKDLHELGNNDYVLQHACMDSFPVSPWWPLSKKASSFLKRCRDGGNAEALFKQGMYEYFTSPKKEPGLELLKRATEKGHVEATYVYGILLLCSLHEDKRLQALKILSCLKNTSTSRRFKVGEFRRRVKQILSGLWVHKSIIIVVQRVEEAHGSDSRRCKCWNTCSKGWEEDDHGDTCSEACFWDREAALFCDLIRTSSCFR